MRNKTTKCIYKRVNLLYYKQRSLLRVSATYGGHFQVFFEGYIRQNVKTIYKYKMLRFK